MNYLFNVNFIIVIGEIFWVYIYHSFHDSIIYKFDIYVLTNISAISYDISTLLQMIEIKETCKY
jgi:hypothetical protein